MWRRLSNLPGNPDSSDQSISEEEEVDVSLGENDEMLCPREKTKEEGRGLPLQTKLEKLIGGELNHDEETCYVSLEATPRNISSSLEQVPDSPEESYFSSSTRDDLPAQESDEIPPVTTWSAISKEAQSLLHLNGIASSVSSSLRAKRGSKVVKDNNVRPKFSFHSHAHGETSSKIGDMAEYFELADDQAAMEEDPIAECPNSFDEISDNTQDAAVSNLLIIPPPPDKIRVTKRSSKSYSRREVKCFKFAHRGSSSNIQDSDSDDTDDKLPGPMDSSGSSTDDEPSYQTSVPDISNQKKQFVGDRFNEAVKASSLSKEGLSFDSPKLSGGSSLYGKLQLMMKQEKETEIVITKKLQGGNGQADASSSSIDIKIISRNLEGKLIVCKCSVIDLPGDSLLLKNTQGLAAKETETTVIFNPKVCGDVDIEIGCFVRVHAPWKEIKVKNSKEIIILCSYFSSW